MSHYMEDQQREEFERESKVRQITYDKNGTRLTDCCGVYSTYFDDVLCCKKCKEEVAFGQGDGAEIKRVPVTAGAKKLPVFDMNGKRIHTGDTLEVQHCVGRYGQTKIARMTVKTAHWMYGSEGITRAMYDFNSNTMICEYTHNDFEHGHDTWARIVK